MFNLIECISRAHYNMSVCKLIGMYVPVFPNDPNGSDMCRIYSSMELLWKNRETHKIVIVAILMPDAKLGLPALKRYCQNTEKVLFLDVHAHHSGCVLPPDIVEVINPKSKINDPDNRIPNYKEYIMALESYMYDSLCSMAKMGLAGLYHEFVPVCYNSDKNRLESIYGDLVYVPASS